MKTFKEMFINEAKEYRDSFGNPDSEALYREVLRKIIDVDDNYAVMFPGRLDVLPKSAEAGDFESGPELAKQLLPKIQKAVKPFNISAELINVNRGTMNTRINRLHGAIKFTWNSK